MKVLYVVFKALLGGHVLSAITIARHMRKQGVTPFFAGTDGILADEIRHHMPFEPVDIPIYHGTRETYFTWSSFPAIARLREIVRRHQIDLIHAFDSRSYMHAYSVGLQEKVPVLCTICGGVDPYYNVPIAPVIIVFSEEQKRKMIDTYGWASRRVEVIRTRLDLQQVLSAENLLTDEEAARHGLDPIMQKVMMISSFDNSKIESIHKVLDAAELLYSQGTVFQLVLIGGKGELHDQARLRGLAIHKHHPSARIVFTGPVLRAFRLLQRAEVVLGVGRSAFEGMAYGKPTLIVGQGGFAGTVSPETVHEIAWYNFSGRNLRHRDGVEALAKEIESKLKDERLRQQLGDFGLDYVMNKIDVALGVRHIAELYNQVLESENQLGHWQQWLSFGACLVPVVRDNVWHTAKEWFPALRRLRRSALS